MTYQVVKAEDMTEASKVSGYEIGQLCYVTDLLISHAGLGTYTVIPVVRPLEDSEKQELRLSVEEVKALQHVVRNPSNHPIFNQVVS